MQDTIKNRTIFCHDNLEVLQGIDTGTIDLIYLDPPFNTNRIFTAPTGSNAEGASFEDVFKEQDVKDEWLLTIKEDMPELHDLLNGIKGMGNFSNYCYLCYMAIRLIECHRVLKDDSGSAYLHCDPTMSHYLKLVMDCIFGDKNFLNEIIWHYTGGGRSRSYFSKKHDIIFWYRKGGRQTFNIDDVRVPYEESSGYAKGGITAKSGKHYMPHPKGKAMDDVWGLPIVNPMSRERKLANYPTQKPIALLERIITASSNKGEIILDPFCGCATACVAAERLGRKWIGIDVSVQAYNLVKKRLQDEMDSGTDLFNFDVEKDITYLTNPPRRTDSGRVALLKKYVYVISNEAYPGEYKVGIASDVDKRLSSYQTSDPARGYKVEHKLLTHKFREIEKAIHNDSDFTVRHEWVTGDLKKIIDKIKKLGKA